MNLFPIVAMAGHFAMTNNGALNVLDGDPEMKSVAWEDFLKDGTTISRNTKE